MKILLINPYVYDFACYDYWTKPLGLLYMSALLKEKGHTVDLVDCMDRHHPALVENTDEKYGKGHYCYESAVKPLVFKKYPKKYKKYGLYGEKLNNILYKIKSPDMVIVSSSMTYWYLGVKDVTETVSGKEICIPLSLSESIRAFSFPATNSRS